MTVRNWNLKYFITFSLLIFDMINFSFHFQILIHIKKRRKKRKVVLKSLIYTRHYVNNYRLTDNTNKLHLAFVEDLRYNLVTLN